MFSIGNLSHYSFHRSLLSPEELVGLAVEQGYAGVGLSDWFGFWGAVPFQKACEARGLKAIHGVRLLVGRIGELHIIVLSNEAYPALSTALSDWQEHWSTDAVAGAHRCWTAAFRLPPEALAAWWSTQPAAVREGLTFLFPLTSETAAPFAGEVIRPDPDQPHPPLYLWQERYRTLHELLSGAHLCAELRPLRRPTAEIQRRIFQSWEMTTGSPLPAILCTAACLRDAAQVSVWESLQSIGTLTLRRDYHPLRSLPGLIPTLPPVAEMRARFGKRPPLFTATQTLADRATFRFTLDRLFIPGIGGGVARVSASPASSAPPAEATPPLPAPSPEDDELEALCRQGLTGRYAPSVYPWPERPSDTRIRERLARELAVVRETGYAGYFLIFHRIVEECRRRGMDLLARGSAAGGLICYALGVSNVCPFRFGLSFERFLNRDRLRFSKLPDIDLDLPWDQRDEIIHSVYASYGADRVAMIGGFNCFQARAALADLARARGIPESVARSWTRFLPQGGVQRFLRERVHWIEVGDIEKEHPEALEILAEAVELDGRPRHPMMHPCGIVIADRALTTFSPLMPSRKGFRMTQMDMDAVEDLGILKLDLLGQAGLSVLRDAEANIRAETAETGGAPVDPWAGFRFDHADIFAGIRTGQARGIFHIESPAMTQLLRLCQCRDIDCLVATVSVIRPGAANEDKKTAFARRYLGREKPFYHHPDLEPILRDTFGLMVYEEHIIYVAHQWAGIDLGMADRLRRILVRKKEGSELDEIGETFRAAARTKGYAETVITRVWSMLVDFSGYMFNKAHGAAYAVEAYRGMWLKHFWPGAFLAAVLRNQRGFYHPVVYICEALHRGIRLRGPSVQDADGGYHWKADGGAQGSLCVPLTQLKGLGNAAIEAWQKARATGPFHDWEDFRYRVPLDPADAIILAQGGALDDFFPTRREALWQIRRESQPGARNGTGEFPGWQHRLALPASLGAETPEERARGEEELLGYAFSRPAWEYPEGGGWEPGQVTLAEAHRRRRGEVLVAGRIVVRRGHTTRRGERMSFITLVDATGFLEISIFPPAYQRFGFKIARSVGGLARISLKPDDTNSGSLAELLEWEPEGIAPEVLPSTILR